MPDLIIERQPISPQMQVNLKNYILRERKRKKDEDVANEQKIKEEIKKAEMTSQSLEHTKEQIRQYEKKLEELQAKKRDLYNQLKKVLNEETNLKKGSASQTPNSAPNKAPQHPQSPFSGASGLPHSIPPDQLLMLQNAMAAAANALPSSNLPNNLLQQQKQQQQPQQLQPPPPQLISQPPLSITNIPRPQSMSRSPSSSSSHRQSHSPFVPPSQLHPSYNLPPAVQKYFLSMQAQGNPMPPYQTLQNSHHLAPNSAMSSSNSNGIAARHHATLPSSASSPSLSSMKRLRTPSPAQHHYFYNSILQQQQQSRSPSQTLAVSSPPPPATIPSLQSATPSQGQFNSPSNAKKTRTTSQLHSSSSPNSNPQSFSRHSPFNPANMTPQQQQSAFSAYQNSLLSLTSNSNLNSRASHTVPEQSGGSISNGTTANKTPQQFGRPGVSNSNYQNQFNLVYQMAAETVQQMLNSNQFSPHQQQQLMQQHFQMTPALSAQHHQQQQQHQQQLLNSGGGNSHSSISQPGNSGAGSILTGLIGFRPSSSSGNLQKPSQF